MDKKILKKLFVCIVFTIVTCNNFVIAQTPSVCFKASPTNCRPCLAQVKSIARKFKTSPVTVEFTNADSSFSKELFSEYFQNIGNLSLNTKTTDLLDGYHIRELKKYWKLTEYGKLEKFLEDSLVNISADTFAYPKGIAKALNFNLVNAFEKYVTLSNNGKNIAYLFDKNSFKIVDSVDYGKVKPSYFWTKYNLLEPKYFERGDSVLKEYLKNKIELQRSFVHKDYFVNLFICPTYELQDSTQIIGGLCLLHFKQIGGKKEFYRNITFNSYIDQYRSFYIQGDSIYFANVEKDKYVRLSSASLLNDEIKNFTVIKDNLPLDKLSVIVGESYFAEGYQYDFKLKKEFILSPNSTEFKFGSFILNKPNYWIRNYSKFLTVYNNGKYSILQMPYYVPRKNISVHNNELFIAIDKGILKYKL